VFYSKSQLQEERNDIYLLFLESVGADNLQQIWEGEGFLKLRLDGVSVFKIFDDVAYKYYYRNLILYLQFGHPSVFNRKLQIFFPRTYPVYSVFFVKEFLCFV